MALCHQVGAGAAVTGQYLSPGQCFSSKPRILPVCPQAPEHSQPPTNLGRKVWGLHPEADGGVMLPGFLLLQGAAKLPFLMLRSHVFHIMLLFVKTAREPRLFSLSFVF